jgi:hypothetical protein
MKKLIKTIKATIITVGIAFGISLGMTQPSEAAIPTGTYYPYYNNYYNSFLTYWSFYNTYHVTCYYYDAYAFYYYYLAGYLGDGNGYIYDPLGNKSDKHVNPGYYSSYTYDDNYFNLYAYYGDYYWRVCNAVASR